jgi:hypothetical protein
MRRRRLREINTHTEREGKGETEGEKEGQRERDERERNSKKREKEREKRKRGIVRREREKSAKRDGKTLLKLYSDMARIPTISLKTSFPTDRLFHLAAQAGKHTNCNCHMGKWRIKNWTTATAVAKGNMFVTLHDVWEFWQDLCRRGAGRVASQTLPI